MICDEKKAHSGRQLPKKFSWNCLAVRIHCRNLPLVFNLRASRVRCFQNLRLTPKGQPSQGVQAPL